MVHQQKRSWFPQAFLGAIFALALACAPAVVEAATLYLSPANASIAGNGSVTMNVMVNSADQAMNAAQGVVDFPANLVQVTGISKAGSVVSLWVQEPSFNNATGRVSFEGIVLNPGYTGSAGKILAITFKAKGSGSADITFPSASILANDGNGTNILTSLGRGKITIGTTAPQPTEPSQPSAPSAAVPGLPVISSATHPDAKLFYRSNAPEFSWALPAGVTDVNFVADKNAVTDPGTSGDGLLRSWKYTDVADGRWYFHLKFKNSAGWGPTAHYAFNIDTVAPIIAVEQRSVPTASEKVFKITAQEEGSGVVKYEVSVNGGKAVTWLDEKKDGLFRVNEGLLEGENVLTVAAFDAAGNRGEKVVNFTSVAPVCAATESGFVTAQYWLFWILIILNAILLLFLAREHHRLRKHAHHGK